MKQQLIMTKGLPGSGKTTWALEHIKKHPEVFKRINKDELRAMIDGGKWSKKNEKTILMLRDMLVNSALCAGYSVIVDDTNLAPKHQKTLKDIVDRINEGVPAYNPDETIGFEIRYFTDVPIEECIKRDLARSRSVGEKVIRQMHKQFFTPKPTVTERNPELPDTILCDLDGTIALLNGRDPYEPATVLDDKPNEPIIDLVRKYLLDENMNVVFVSGRMEKYREETQKWLYSHIAIKDPILFMRPDGDMRKDSIIKNEIYSREICGKYNVLFVLDDRNQVVELWRSLGLTCLQVAEGDF